MMENNTNSKESEYSSELEKYMEEHEESYDYDETNDFQPSSKGSSKLDQYLGIDDEEEEEEVNYCSICGKELKKFNYGDKCDECIKKIEVVKELNTLLDYMSPSEELNKETLRFIGLDELKLDIIISHLLNENLIVLGSKGIFLADVKTINDFFRKYGSTSDLLDESLYKNVMFSEGFVDISNYTDLVQLLFNFKNNKWEVILFRDGKSILKKFFISILDANDYAIHYLKEMGELDNLQDKKPIKPQKVKSRRSKHKFVFFSTKRNQWFVKVKGVAGYKLVGFYDTEKEAVIARDSYLKMRKANRDKLRPKFVKDESDAKIKFHERSNQWVVIVKKKNGRFRKLGYYDTEEEAIVAKNEYYGIGDDSNQGSILAFSEGDMVQVLSGHFESECGVVQGYNEERDSFIIKFENPEINLPVFIKSNNLKLF